MNKKKNPEKSDFVKFILTHSDHVSEDKETAERFLKEESVDTARLISNGLQKIKQLQMQAEARKTTSTMTQLEPFAAKALEWVDKLLNDINFSLPDFVKNEKLTVSFRSLEDLSKDDLKNILIQHFTLKFFNEQKNESE